MCPVILRPDPRDVDDALGEAAFAESESNNRVWLGGLADLKKDGSVNDRRPSQKKHQGNGSERRRQNGKGTGSYAGAVYLPIAIAALRVPVAPPERVEAQGVEERRHALGDFLGGAFGRPDEYPRERHARRLVEVLVP